MSQIVSFTLEQNSYNQEKLVDFLQNIPNGNSIKKLEENVHEITNLNKDIVLYQFSENEVLLEGRFDELMFIEFEKLSKELNGSLLVESSSLNDELGKSQKSSLLLSVLALTLLTCVGSVAFIISLLLFPIKYLYRQLKKK